MPAHGTLEQVTKRYRLRDPNDSNIVIAECLGFAHYQAYRGDGFFYILGVSATLVLVAIRTKQDEVAIFKTCPVKLHTKILDIADEIAADGNEETRV